MFHEFVLGEPGERGERGFPGRGQKGYPGPRGLPGKYKRVRTKKIYTKNFLRTDTSSYLENIKGVHETINSKITVLCNFYFIDAIQKSDLKTKKQNASSAFFSVKKD